MGGCESVRVWRVWEVCESVEGMRVWEGVRVWRV